VLDVVRDESSKDAPVRLVFEPKSQHVSTQQELITALLAHTSLETSSPVNLTMVGLDGKPMRKSLRQMLLEWVSFPPDHHRAAYAATGLDKVLDRIHILEGRQTGVAQHRRGDCHHPQQSDEPKAALIARFNLSGPSGRRHSGHPPAPTGAAWKPSRSSRSCLELRTERASTPGGHSGQSRRHCAA